MALKVEVERLLAKITDPAARAEAAKMYEAHTFMQDAVLAQEDYSRRIQETARDQKAANDKFKANTEWYRTESIKVADIEADKERMLQEADTMRAELETLRAARGEAGNEGASAAALAKFDAKMTSIERQLKDSQAAQADVLTKANYEKDLKTRADNVVAFTFDVVEAKERHMREFGEPLAKDDLFKFMNDHGIQTVDDAYTRMTADKRKTNWETAKEKEIEDRLMAKISAMKLPMGDGSGSVPVRGPLQQWINKEVTGIPEGVMADGSGRLASIAAQALRDEGKV